MASLSRPRPEKHVLGNWIPHSEKVCRTYQDLSDFLMLCQAGDNLLCCVRVQPGSSLGAYGPETLPNGFRV